MKRVSGKKIIGHIVVNHKKVEVTGENGKFWVCGSRQFRKATHKIVRKKEVKKDDV